MFRELKVENVKETILFEEKKYRINKQWEENVSHEVYRLKFPVAFYLRQ